MERGLGVVKAEHPRLKGHGFNSQLGLSVKALGKLCDEYCLWPPNYNRYLVEQNDDVRVIIQLHGTL